MPCRVIFFLIASGALTSCSTRKLLNSRYDNPSGGPLVNFEVQQPPVVPDSQPCELTLLKHTFANSYGQPGNATYSPPRGCGEVGSWASVIFSMTTTSIGNQYDRLGQLYWNGIEIWRTSTAEPTKSGIIWTVNRDMTKYMALLSNPGSLSLDLGNVIDSSTGLTGAFDVTLSAKFYPPTKDFPASKTADRIINIGRMNGHHLTQFLTFPQNIESAFVELFASGSGQEEFWYSNAPDQYVKKIDPKSSGTAVGKGPFREVQVWIDNLLAGVVYPFPVIYTGGILLTWWRPIAGIGAFDAPSYVIDISPFIPFLSDSRSHNFTLIVQGQGQGGSINPEWLFSGSIFINLDPSGFRTTGKMLTHSTDTNTTVESIPEDDTDSSASDSTIDFLVKSYRKLSTSSEIITGSGTKQTFKFEQDLTYSNRQSWTSGGNYQSILMSSQGSSLSTHGDIAVLTDNFKYPLSMTLSTVTLSDSEQTSLFGHLIHSYTRSQNLSLFPSLGQIDIDTTQDSVGDLVLNSAGRANSGSGRTGQLFNYKDGRSQTYTREVEISNITEVIRDETSGTLAQSHSFRIKPKSFSFLENKPIRFLKNTERPPSINRLYVKGSSASFLARLVAGNPGRTPRLRSTQVSEKTGC